MPPILVLIPNWLGDAVMSLPALRELRRQGPLLACGSPALLHLLVDLGEVDQVEPYDRRGADAGAAGLWRAATRLRAHRPRQAVVFPPSLRAAALARAARVPRRRGFVGEGRALLLNDRRRSTAPRGTRHLADDWLALARDDGRVVAGEAVPRATAGPVGRAALAQLRAGMPQLPPSGSFVALAPGATYGPTKRWSVDHYAALGLLLAEALALRCVVVGGPDPQERALCDAVAKQTQGVSVAGATDLVTLAALLAQAAVFVGNDSGPMHLAAALGVPTLGIFGSTSPGWTAPRGVAARAFGPHPVPCTPCFRATCPIGLPCLEQLQPRAAFEAIQLLLATAPRRAGGAAT